MNTLFRSFSASKSPIGEMPWVKESFLSGFLWTPHCFYALEGLMEVSADQSVKMVRCSWCYDVTNPGETVLLLDTVVTWSHRGVSVGCYMCVCTLGTAWMTHSVRNMTFIWLWSQRRDLAAHFIPFGKPIGRTVKLWLIKQQRFCTITLTGIVRLQDLISWRWWV